MYICIFVEAWSNTGKSLDKKAFLDDIDIVIKKGWEAR